MNASLLSGSNFNESEVKKVIFQHVEKPFTMENGIFPNMPTGNISAQLKMQSKLATSLCGRYFLTRTRMACV